MESLAGAVGSNGGRRLAFAVALILAAGTALVAPHASVQLGESVAFLTIFLTIAAGADALTAFLLANQARVGRSPSLLILACGYVFSACATVVQAMLFPGIFSATGLFGAGAQSATWFWVWWHGGFPLFVFAYAIVRADRDDERGHRISAPVILACAVGVVAFVGTLAALTILDEHALPTLIAKGRYGLLIPTGVGPLVMLAIAAAIVAMVRFARLRTITDVWLTVALVSSFLDCSLTLVAGGRYTVGWYAGRVESLFASTIVLLTLLGALGRILERLALLSRVDGLTGLANRRSFDDELEAQVALAARVRRPVSLLMLDVDSFKLYNDSYGHARGDEALRAVAGTIAKALPRRTDFAARYGGEEFVAILPATDAIGARAVAERIRRSVAERAIPHIAAARGIVTVSIGTSTLAFTHADGPLSAGALVDRADEALYRAKDAGRDRVESAHDPMTASGIAAQSVAPASVS